MDCGLCVCLLIFPFSSYSRRSREHVLILGEQHDCICSKLCVHFRWVERNCILENLEMEILYLGMICGDTVHFLCHSENSPQMCLSETRGSCCGSSTLTDEVMHMYTLRVALLEAWRRQRSRFRSQATFTPWSRARLLPAGGRKHLRNWGHLQELSFILYLHFLASICISCLGSTLPSVKPPTPLLLFLALVKWCLVSQQWHQEVAFGIHLISMCIHRTRQGAFCCTALH